MNHAPSGLRALSVLLLSAWWAVQPASAQSTFFKTFGMGSYAEGYALTAATGGGYVATGRVGQSFNDDVLIVRTSSAGDTTWTRRLRSEGNDYGYGVCASSDGGYVVTGFTNGLGAGEMDVLLVKTSATGSVLWSRTYGGSRTDQAFGVQQTSDGGFIVGGFTTDNYVATGADFLLLKTDASGNLSWARAYGGEAGEHAFAVCQTSDGGFALVGGTTSYGAGGDDIWLVKTDAAGTLLWSRTYGGASYDEATSVYATNDGGVVVAGRTLNFGAGNTDILVIRTNSAGDVQWARTFGGNSAEAQVAIQPTPEGGCAISAATSSFGDGTLDAYLVVTDATGTPLLSRTFGASGLDFCYGVTPATDGGYTLVGSSGSFGPTAPSLTLIKTNAAGSSGCFGASAATISGTPSLTVTTPAPTATSRAFANAAAPFSVTSGGSVLVQSG